MYVMRQFYICIIAMMLVSVSISILTIAKCMQHNKKIKIEQVQK